jgi:predicted nucleic acid-binding protein
LSEAHRHRFEAPHVFPAEVRNLLLKLERRGRFDAVFTARAIASLAAYDVRVDEPPSERAYDDVLDIARRERLSVYDALYLRQALGGGIAVASRDGDLIAAAAANGLTCLDLRGVRTWPMPS